MMKRMLLSYIDFFANHPLIIILGAGLLDFVLELLGTRPFFRVIDSSPAYRFAKYLFFGAIILSLIGSWVFEKIVVEKARFQNAAETLGMECHIKNYLPAEALLRLPVLIRGERRDIVSPILSGRHQKANVILFNYRYSRTQSGGETLVVYFRTVLAFSSKRLQVPPFSLFPKKPGDRIMANFFNNGDIKFKEDSGFSGRYQLRSKAPDLLRQFFSPELRRVFTQSEVKWAAGGAGDTFIMFKDGLTDEQVKTTDFKSYLEEAYRIFKTALAQHSMPKKR
ncbi:MAG: hypothetical protein GY797_12000 [Deltaproteobacteria bacterium]|nr:hypothetical protein [Deltaproteobacteria bacterium]